jgi:hypothetical protein
VDVDRSPVRGRIQTQPKGTALRAVFNLARRFEI